MSTSSLNSTSVSSSNSGNHNNNNNNPSSNVLSSSATSNIVILENPMLDSNDVVAAAAGLQQLSNAGAALKLTRDCAVQYSNLLNSYSVTSNSGSGGGNSSGSQMNTVNIIPGDANQASSRVQVLSNVQLVSKGSPQSSTFSYVDASGKNFNVLTSSGKIGQNKLISVPITKVKTFSQQSHIVSSPIQHHQPQQKVTVPRSIQLVTRIPNSTISVSNGGRMSQIASTMPVPQQQPQTTQQFTIQQYPDSSANIPASLEIKSSVTGTIINSSNVSKTVPTKGKSTASLKLMQNSQINQLNTAKSVGKSMSVNLKSVRNNTKTTLSGSTGSQYYIKSSTTGTIQQSGTTTSIYTTSPAQAVYHNPAPQQVPQYSVGGNVGKGGKSLYKTSKNQLIQLQQQSTQHQQPPHQSPQRAVTPTTGPVGNTSGTNSSNYGTSSNSPVAIVHQDVNCTEIGRFTVPQSATVVSRYQSYSSYPISASQSLSCTPTPPSTTNYKSFNHHIYATGGSSPMSTYDPSGSGTTNDHHIPSVTVTSYCATTKGKKYAATVVSNEINSSSYLSSPVKVKNVGRGRNNSLSNSYQTESMTSYQRYAASPSRTQQQFQPPQQISTPTQQQAQHTSINSGKEEQIFINGQQMTDETSARILQSLSQKAASEGGLSTSTVKYGNYRQQQFTYYGSENVPQVPISTVPSSNNPIVPNQAGVIYDPSDARFYEDKSGGRRSSTSDVVTFADNIPLREGFPSHYIYNQRDDEDQIGVEIRPAPVDITNGRYHILQAILQDHTYCAPIPDLKIPEPTPTPIPAQTQIVQSSNVHVQQQSGVSHQQQLQHQQQPQQHVSQQQYYIQQQQQHLPQISFKQKPSSPVQVATSLPTDVSPVAASNNVSISSASVPAPLTQINVNAMTAITSSVATTVSTSSTSTSNAGPTVMTQPLVQQPLQSVASQSPITAVPAIASSTLDYIFQQRQSMSQDDDANSVISTGSRNFNNTDNDLGEETETAPEGEGEDDSVTRCICDLTHDDGYMICCDKCSAWQHVDCMGIDRMNIPDEYNCEMCQPRAVDKTRARQLQMEKRKEQSLFLSNNNSQVPVGDAAVSSTNLLSATSTGAPATTTPTSARGANQYTTGKVLGNSKKNKTNAGSTKKKTTDGTVTKKANKKTIDNSISRVNGKRKELKKTSKKKTKTTEPNAEKMSNMIRTWIDNYERASTNHYSPELRARLQAFGKMQSQNPLLNSDRLIPSENAGIMTNMLEKCTTVPHAGGKILISTGDIEPKTPIIEIQGKYMLSSQHKQLQSLFNMAANGKLNNNKNAGPFLFLYQFTSGGMELCVDTRTYGNDARFIRRSCRPNAEILHNVEKGVIHLYIVSTTNIKANTEITIKHDEQLIQRVGGVVILTHTTVTNLCACGLIKECQYSAQLNEGLLPLSSGGTTTAAVATSTSGGNISQSVVSSTTTTITASGKQSKNKRNNGALVGDIVEKKPTKKRNSRSSSSNIGSRLRSISSSGDSTSDIMMYTQQQQCQLQQQSGVQSLHQQIIGQPQLSPLHQQQQQFQLSPHQPQQQQHHQQQSLPSIPGQLIPQHLHFIHHQQQQPSTQTPFNHPSIIQSPSSYMCSPSPTHQQQSQQQPPQQPTQLLQQSQQQLHSATPSPSISPVITHTSRPGFYTEIKSPISSPPMNLSGPPPLAIPVSSPTKTVPILLPSTQMATPPINQQEQSASINQMSNVPTQPLHKLHEIRKPAIYEVQQQSQNQQIVEEVSNITIKSPVVSPIKQEPICASPSSSSMLSPPPPPPAPITQRLLCAEALKNELFHTHHYQQQIQPTRITSPSRQLQQNQPQTLLQPGSPVKTECISPTLEIKQEPSLLGLSPTHLNVTETCLSPIRVKIEPEIKEEKEPHVVTSFDDQKPSVNIVKIEEPFESEAPSIPSEPETMPLSSEIDEIKEEKIPLVTQSSDTVIPDSSGVTSSPRKASTTSTGNSTSNNSSPHSTSHSQQHHGGSGNKKKVTKESTDVEKEEKKPSRKLTREERKMEAIVKAFEKMEQSQQRKQELKEQRKEGSKRRSVSSSTPDEAACAAPSSSGGSSTKKKSLSSQKRKKKKSKSMSQNFGSPNQSRKKKVSKTSKLSKKNSTLKPISSAQPDSSNNERPYESKAAELLLTFSQSSDQSQQQVAATASSTLSYFGDDVKPLQSQSTSSEIQTNTDNESTDQNITDVPLLSSACMLVEAAVGPLEQVATPPVEQDFKFPQKAKTKKSMSREWLSGNQTTMDTSGNGSNASSVAYQRITPDHDSGYISEEKAQDALHRSSNQFEEDMETPLVVDVGDSSINIVAKKVEEFIAQNSPQPDEGNSHKWEDKITGSPSMSNVPDNCSTPGNSGCASERAVKKRWLRQAKTDEQASSSPPPPNGFTTPLKKRRVIPQSDERQEICAQKIDFLGQQQQTISNYSTDGNVYWSNTGSSILTYPHSVLDEKQAMDLSKNAPIRIQHPRIQPYKIVPIAQALTPLHFTDPDPLPLPPVIIPTSVATSNESHHRLIPQETLELPMQTLSAVGTLSASYESSQTLPPPPSAVAAIVPASLLPPKALSPVSLTPANQIHQARIDVSYNAFQQVSLSPSTSNPTVSGITRSKGSQKYIGSPAKFGSQSPGGDSLNSSVTETPEKSSCSGGSVANSDVDDDMMLQAEQNILTESKVECSYQPMIGLEQESVIEEVVTNDPNDTLSRVAATGAGDDSEKMEINVSEDNVRIDYRESAVLHEEEFAANEIEIAEDLQEIGTSETIADITDEGAKSEDINISVESETCRTVPSPIDMDASSSTEIDSREQETLDSCSAEATHDEQCAKSVKPEEDNDKSELEDLQKVIASFHSENIMNLISRNKKSKKSVSKEGSSEEKLRTTKKQPKKQLISKQCLQVSTAEPVEQIPSLPATETTETVSADIESSLTTIDSPESTFSAETTALLSTTQPAVFSATQPSVMEVSVSTLGRSYSHSSWHSTSDSYRDTASEVRSFSTLRPDIPPISYNSPTTYQSTAARNLLSSLSVGSEPLSTLGSYRSSTSSFLDYPKSSSISNTTGTSTSVGTSGSIYQYRPSTEISTLLEKGFSSTRSTSFSSLSSALASERTSSNTSIERIGGGSNYFLSSTNSPKVTENLSTLGSTGSSYPKIFTKTASSDPRLNPALNTPEPPAPITPKRKLSINEYRQRKMQFTSSSVEVTVGTTIAATAISSSIAASASSSNSSSGSNSRDDCSSSNAISSSLGSNDVSSSISKELCLELELELTKTGEEISNRDSDCSSADENTSVMINTVAGTLSSTIPSMVATTAEESSVSETSMVEHTT